MKILFLSWWWPYPADNGSKARIYGFLEHLSKLHSVTLFSFAEPSEATPQQLAHMRTFCHRVEVIRKPEFRPNSAHAIGCFLSKWPRSLVAVYSPRMETLVRQACATGNVDLVIASQLQTMRYLHHTRGVPGILEEIETAVFHDRVRDAGTFAARVRSRLTLVKLERSLRAVLDSCSACTVVSELEQTLLRRVVPARQRVHIVPNGVDVRRLDFMPDHPPTPHSLIYTGAITYSANLEAVTDFIEHAWPLIRSSYPQATFTVTGETRGVNIGPLAAKPGVMFSGRLESVREALSSSCALVTPIRTGGGTRVKILEAMAIGTPVVATRKAAEGLHVEDGIHLLLADSPAEWADAVQRLFDDPALRDRIARAARAYVEREHDSSQMAQRLHALAQESQR